ncbi:MAG TPA: type II CAAX endopeptidase family protein [Longimicrobiales bacterium]|nr:type II CAAX endopeptidase family protein [Longimicrobiales bacterium]
MVTTIDVRSAAGAGAAGAEERREARAKVVTYLILTLLFSSIFYALIISAGSLSVHGGAYVFALMWSPGTAALLTRLLRQRNLRGEGWGWGGTRWQLLAYVLPMAYATVAYGAVWLLGLGGVHAYERSMLVFLTLGTAQSCLSALGEELGWRGLLVPELAKLTSFTRTSLISGGIWALWHMPLILFADYNSGTPKWFAVLCFAVMVVAIAFPFAWLRLVSGSVWTGMFLHASHNLWIQGFFDRITVDTGTTRWYTTEFGAALALTTTVVAFVFWRLRDRVPSTAGALAGGTADSPEPAAAGLTPTPSEP